MFKRIINKQLKEEQRMIDEDLQKKAEQTRKKGRIMFYCLGGLTIILIVFSSLILLEYKTLEHEYIITSCDLSCIKQYDDTSYFAEGYSHNDDGSYTCVCANESRSLFPMKSVLI